jgi:flagellar basal-body rod protein FlgB
MWVERLTASRTTRALELASQFAEQRQHVLAENLANVDAPDFHSRRLDAQPFQVSLAAALDRASQSGSADLDLRDNAQFSTRPDGQIAVRPAVEPAPNALFHDGTNASVEQLVSQTTENALSYDLATSLLRQQLGLTLQAIRGRSS